MINFLLFLKKIRKVNKIFWLVVKDLKENCKRELSYAMLLTHSTTKYSYMQRQPFFHNT